MKGYIGGDDGPSPLSESIALDRGVSATHVLSYRWNDVDGRYNSDVGQIFLRDGVVVGTDFLPD
jgi:hypothetical protein